MISWRVIKGKLPTYTSFCMTIIYGIDSVKRMASEEGSLSSSCLQASSCSIRILSVVTLRVPVPKLGVWAIVIIVQVRGEYMIIGYLDP